MADRNKLINALRKAHDAGDTEGATRIAGMIKALPQEAPQAPQGATPTQPTPQTTQAPTEASSPLESAFNSVGEVAAGMGRITAGAVSDLANVGVGVGNAVLSAADWGAEQMGSNIDYRIPKAGYGAADKYLAPRGTGEEVVASIPSYMIGGELVAPVKAAAGASRVARAGVSMLNQLPAAITGDLSEHNQGDLSASNIALNAALPGVVEKVGGSVVKGVRNVLPETFGGYSQAQKAAGVVSEEAANRVYQGGDVEAQQAYRTATTDAEGNSILLPSQTFNTEAGNKYIAAENRDMLRGDKSKYNSLLAQQQSGESLQRAVVDADTGKTLQSSAQDITEQFKQQSNTLYNESKANAQAVLDSKRIKSLKFPDTKSVVDTHIAQHNKTGVGLNAETRRTLNQFKKSNISTIDELDQWKRVLSEKSSKAYRAGDHTSSQALRDTLNSLRGEADSIINRIDPNAGSIYREADKYFSESVGDFGTGKKSVLGKMASNESESAANNMLVGTSQRAAERADNASLAMQDALASGSLNDAANLSLDFAGAMGSATRNEALRVGSTGANFSPTKFANRLNQLQPQAQAATDLSSLVGGKSEVAVNNALADAVGITRTKAKGVGRVTNALASGTGRVVGAGVGGAVGTAFGGAAGAAIGAGVGERAAKVIGEGLLDRLAGLPNRGQKYIQFLSDPANAKLIMDIHANQGGLNAPVEAIKSTIDAITQSSYSNISNNSVQPTYQAPEYIEPDEPVQHAQVAHKPEATQSDDFDPKITKFYRAISHAETGNLKNRFIRTKAAEAGVSTAYGAAQLTVTTAKDFYKRHPELFNEQEKDYLQRFFDQGEKMKRASDNDPVYGYGGHGVLGGAEDRKLYSRVVRKMLTQMVKDNHGSLDKTLNQWRGNDKDIAYRKKVHAAFNS
ncbi:hypothetical protein QUR06_000267 [Escherichia coli]|nr:hypothetical protein [Escherichia coli]